MIVAHRGASKNAPENTIPAFKLAWEQNADAIEGDFRLTKDGHIVCIHDANTERTTGKNLVVAQSTLADLQALDAGSWKRDAFEGTKIPTIAEVFASIPKGKTIYVEIKCGTEIIDPLLKSIKVAKLTAKQVVIICFNEDVIREMKATAPQYRAYWLVSVNRDKSGRRKPTTKDLISTAKAIKADGVSTSWQAINEAYVKRVMDQGLDYHVWTVDDPDAAERLLSWGVGSITTNVPGEMAEIPRTRTEQTERKGGHQ